MCFQNYLGGQLIGRSKSASERPKSHFVSEIPFPQEDIPLVPVSVGYRPEILGECGFTSFGIIETDFQRITSSTDSHD
jgi:hypothetical protein